jgi:NAD(P)-dependent dehydrogenase (short-subunit alcohol dehydrogenase family)
MNTGDEELVIPKDFAAQPGLLAGRVVLITGASGGLGRALSLECARVGASVVLAGRNLAKLEKLYDEIVAAGAPRPALAVLDLATATAVEYDALATVMMREFGKLDGLVHAAALLGDRAPLEQYDIPTWCKVLHVNLTAAFILTQVMLPALRKSADASVIFVSSGVVKKARPFWGAYAISKTGLDAVRAMWAEELEGEPNIRLNSVNPGPLRTSMRAAAYPAEDPSLLRSPHSVSGAFLYLLSGLGRAIDGEFIDAQ